MSKSKRRRRRSSPPPPSQLKPAVDPLGPLALETAQTRHVEFLETWSASLPTVAGVNPVQAFSYELCQVLNDAYLREHLPS